MSIETETPKDELYQQSVDFYEADASSYDEKRWTTPAGKYLNRVQINIVCEQVGAEGGVNHLDIATGTGRFAVNLATRGAQVTALDSSQNMLKECMKRADREGVSERLTTFCGFANEMEYTGQFDSCTCINALNHIPDQNGVIQSAAEALKEGGHLVTNYTNWISFYMPIGLYINLRGKSIHGNVYTKWFSLREIRKLHRDNGLEIVEVQGVVHIPTRVRNPLLMLVLKTLDKMSRRSILRFFAPQLYIKAIKK